MKIIIGLLVLLTVTQISDACEFREYAQIKEMGTPQLQHDRDLYAKLMDVSFKSIKDFYDINQRPPRHIQSQFDTCKKELDKIDQVLKSRQPVATDTQTQNTVRAPNSDNQIYRSVDSSGTLVFSDNPQETPTKTSKKRR